MKEREHRYQDENGPKVGSAVCVLISCTPGIGYMVNEYLTDLTTGTSKVVTTEQWNTYSIFIGTKHYTRQEDNREGWYDPRRLETYLSFRRNG